MPFNSIVTSYSPSDIASSLHSSVLTEHGCYKATKCAYMYDSMMNTCVTGHDACTSGVYYTNYFQAHWTSDGAHPLSYHVESKWSTGATSQQVLSQSHCLTPNNCLLFTFCFYGTASPTATPITWPSMHMVTCQSTGWVEYIRVSILSMHVSPECIEWSRVVCIGTCSLHVCVYKQEETPLQTAPWVLLSS